MTSRQASQTTNTSSSSKYELSAKMAHDLRTPLNTILGFSQMLIQKEKDAAKLHQLEAIHQAGDKLLRMINKIATPATEIEGDAGKTKKESDKDTGLTRDKLAVLPLDLRQKMHKSIIIGDFFQLRTLIEQIAPEHKNITQGLQDLAKRYDQAQLQILFSEQEIFSEKGKPQ